MGFAIFGSSNPQPVPYTGIHLKNLDRFSKIDDSPLAMFILREVMIFGAIFRMIADSGRYTSNAVQDCWQNRDITPQALNSLAHAGRYLILAVFTVALGFFSPSLVVKVADRSGMIPHRTLAQAIGSTLKSTAKVTIVVGTLFCVARACVSTAEERIAAFALAERTIAQIRTWATPLTDKFGEPSVMAFGIATGTFTSVKLVAYVLRSYFPKNHFSV